MGYEYEGQAQVSLEEKKRLAAMRAMAEYKRKAEDSYSVTIPYAGSPDEEVRDVPRVMAEWEYLMKSAHELRDKLSQLEERLDVVMRPVPAVNAILEGQDKDSPCCAIAFRFRTVRELIDEDTNRIRRILNTLEI
jgi:hypothetical protein